MSKLIKDNLDKHWMIDIETFSTKNNALIVSIGIVNVGTLTGDIFYPNLTEQLLNGAHVDPETIKWWNLQDKEAVNGLYGDRSVRPNLDILRTHFSSSIKDGYVWAKPPQFDLTILSSMFGGNPPWSWRNVYDLRTFFAANNTKKGPKVSERGQAHNAYHDALYQARQLRNVLGVDK